MRTHLADHAGLAILVALLALIGLLAGVSWVVIILLLVAMLFLHELGHYLTARMTGMKVTEFFIGFGPRLWSFRRGETEYGIKAVWVGAYVRIAGMSSLEPEDPVDESRSFRRKSYPRKLLVLTAGSGMHFVIALVLLFVLLMVDGRLSVGRAEQPEEVAEWTLATVSVDSAASAAGLQPGDELVSVNGVGRTTFGDFSRQVRQLAGEEVEVVYLRGDSTHTTVTRIGERLTARGAAGIVGLIEGDRILAVAGLQSDGAPTYAQLADYAGPRVGQPIDITIVDTRTGRPVVVEGAIINELVDPSNGVMGFFGVSADYHHPGLGVVGAAGESVRLLAATVRDVVFAIPTIVTDGFGGTLDGLGGGDDPVASPAQSVRELEVRRLDTSHPDENRILSIYGVARIGAEAASDGASNVLLLIMYVNVFLGVFNLLPLLPLDGGHVVVATYERIRSIGGRSHQVDAARLLPLTYAVVALLLLVGGVALVRDILDPVSFG
ncbi:MAG: site-2 protease family protein [Acidimicrobiaceae bacterium]|nr:site-2 protease family protein [Acidimicrobiaceae bacterium]